MKDIELGYNYRLHRRDSMNWELQHFHAPDQNNHNTKGSEPKWYGCGKYYQQLNQALHAMYEMVLREGEECADLKTALDRAEEVASSINANAHLLKLGGK